MKEELVRLTSINLKIVNNTSLLFFEYIVIGKSSNKYVTKIFNPNILILENLCYICNLPFLGIEFSALVSEDNSYPFFALMDKIKSELLAFAPCRNTNSKIEWIPIKENINIPKNISSSIYKIYLMYRELTLLQTFQAMDYPKICDYLKLKIDDFESLNKNDDLMLFIAEVFKNYNYVNGIIYSSLIEGNSKYLKLGRTKFLRQSLSQAFDIVEIGDYFKLATNEVNIFSSIK